MEQPFFLARSFAFAVILAAIGNFGVARSACAYPSSLIFAPSGDVMSQGSTQVFFYNAFYGTAVDAWTGFNVGVIPRYPYGTSGLEFGGVEMGVDVFASPGNDPGIKPIGNIKIGLLNEAGAVPALAIGYMSWAFLHRDRSLNFSYLSASKAVMWGKNDLGRATLGLAHTMPTSPDAFKPTWPLPVGNQALMGGWEFPSIGPFSFAIDTVGGVSELSSTCLVLNLEIVPGTFASVGYTISHNRSINSADAYFLQTYTDFDFSKAIAPKRLN
ncbi:MAG: hypothetical protein VKN33_10340 [Candidatus Sericytochromatia bacterium]|nr:hypothetical protein [Candidatus Sericytochromatia bacterium]